ncbi:hypothetical protein GJAV_G00024520 [Gymnothorax javanicus]|nr:hypothetical protein GJAV_G00024520 [Gymnothorax javanicus]
MVLVSIMPILCNKIAVFVLKQVWCALSRVELPRHCSPGSVTEDRYDSCLSIKPKPAMEAVLSDGWRVTFLARSSNYESAFQSRDMG